MTDINEIMGKILVEKMANMDDDGRLEMLEAVDGMHVAAFVTWLGMEIFEHDKHEEDCPFKDPEEVVRRYIKHFGAQLYKSVEATCEVNGVPYRKDLNKEVRHEILAEINR